MRLNGFLLFLFLLVFLKSLVWSFFIPLWHFPDEQEHFAHVACNAETRKPCGIKSPPHGNLNKEIYSSLLLLGTDRDEHGNNRFTYHPEYNIDYSPNLIGIHEDAIASQPPGSRKEFVKHDMAEYPEFFYDLSKLPYNFLYQKDLFARVLATRLFWFWCLWLIVYCAYKLAQLAFPKKEKLAFTAAVLTAFHPMLTFVSAGVTSDNLFNALFALVVLESALILKYGPKAKFLLLLAVFSFFGFLVKPQFYIALGVIFPVLAWRIISELRKGKTRKIQIFFIFLLIFGLIKSDLITAFINKGLNYFSFNKYNTAVQYSFFGHFFWTLEHTFREVIPWYWGNFRWLSFNLPRWTNRVLMRLLLLAFLGIIYQLLTVFKNAKNMKNNLVFLFLLYVVLLYFGSLFFWDWIFINNSGFSFGIQGRYYFPVIAGHMIILAFGIEGFARLVCRGIEKTGFKIRTQNLIDFSLFILCLWFMALNLIAFFWLTGSYYDLSSLKTYIVQASQYKPWFAKGNYLLAVLSAYLLCLMIFIFCLIKLFFKNASKKNI